MARAGAECTTGPAEQSGGNLPDYTIPPYRIPKSEILMSATIPNDLNWFKDAIIYQVHVKSYFDSNGDGVGDFIGLTRKLDYIQDLGATAIWLMPFYPSPLRDDGYDISNY